MDRPEPWSRGAASPARHPRKGHGDMEEALCRVRASLIPPESEGWCNDQLLSGAALPAGRCSLAWSSSERRAPGASPLPCQPSPAPDSTPSCPAGLVPPKRLPGGVHCLLRLPPSLTLTHHMLLASARQSRQPGPGWAPGLHQLCFKGIERVPWQLPPGRWARCPGQGQLLPPSLLAMLIESRSPIPPRFSHNWGWQIVWDGIRWAQMVPSAASSR